MIKYQKSTKGITPAKMKGFFVDWPNPPKPATHLKLLKNSAKVVVAVDDKTGNAVGFITAITDGVLSAYIPLLEVLPEYQGKGIGKRLIRKMLEQLDKAYMVDLVCDENLRKFYSPFGFSAANAMIKRNYTRQSGGKF